MQSTVTAVFTADRNRKGSWDNICAKSVFREKAVRINSVADSVAGRAVNSAHTVFSDDRVISDNIGKSVFELREQLFGHSEDFKLMRIGHKASEIADFSFV